MKLRDTQQAIDEMARGNIELIIDSIDNKNPAIVRVNALMFGTKYNVHDTKFMEGIKELKNSDETLLNIPINKMAIASEYILKGQKYDGDDRMIMQIVKYGFSC